MAQGVFIEGRRPADKRALNERAIEAGVDLNEIKVAPGGYIVPAELAPKKESRRKREQDQKEVPDEGTDNPGEGEN